MPCSSVSRSISRWEGLANTNRTSSRNLRIRRIFDGDRRHAGTLRSNVKPSQLDFEPNLNLFELKGTPRATNSITAKDAWSPHPLDKRNHSQSSTYTRPAC